MIDLTLEYTTRDGREVFGLVHCPENSAMRIFAGFVREPNGEVCHCYWKYDGTHEFQDQLDLIPKQERWRAEVGGEYAFINSFGEVDYDYETGPTGDSKDRYNLGNYFDPTTCQAQASKFYKVFHD